MKTAVSVPDKLFRLAERLAKRLGVSRSKLYANALEEYVQKRSAENVTEQLNAVFGPRGEGSELDPAWAEASARTIVELTKDDTW